MGVRITAEQIASARERQALSSLVARRVKLAKRGKELLGLCPFHSERTPSFTVRDDKGFFHCFGCGAHGDAIAWRMHWEGETFLEAVEGLNGDAGSSSARPSTRPQPRPAQDEEDQRSLAWRVDTARQIWHEARPIAGTPAERYLRGRGITMALPPTLGFHPYLLHGSKRAGLYLPGLVAAVQKVNGTVTAVHRIFLDPVTCGRDCVPRKTQRTPDKALLGDASGGAVRLTPWARKIGTCEGLETGLSIVQALEREQPLWCGIDATHMALIAWPEATDALAVFADRDPVSTKPGPMLGKRPGEEWARRAATNFLKGRAGRTARIAVPPGEKADFNDLLVAEDAA